MSKKISYELILVHDSGKEEKRMIEGVTHIPRTGEEMQITELGGVAITYVVFNVKHKVAVFSPKKMLKSPTEVYVKFQMFEV